MKLYTPKRTTGVGGAKVRMPRLAVHSVKVPSLKGIKSPKISIKAPRATKAAKIKL